MMQGKGVLVFDHVGADETNIKSENLRNWTMPYNRTIKESHASVAKRYGCSAEQYADTFATASSISCNEFELLL